MPDAIWHPLLTELDRVAAAGRTVSIWLRDDDAVADTPALRRLADLGERHGLPVLLAVIPEPADDGLAAFVAARPILTPAQHGYSHANHAPVGERARELGLRPLAATTADLRRGRARLAALFGPRLADILVPPWNRIDAAVLPALPALGFEALSTFGPPLRPVPGLAHLNADLDIIDWRNGRVGRPHDQLAKRLAALTDEATEHSRPIGLLTHHLAHDETAWAFLDACLPRLARHPAVRFAAATELLRPGPITAPAAGPVTEAPDLATTVPPGRSAVGP